jgi:G5 domain
MSDASHNVYPETYLRTKYYLLKRIPISVRWILLSLLVFSLSGAVSYEQSVMNGKHVVQSPFTSGKTTTLQVASGQPPTSDNTAPNSNGNGAAAPDNHAFVTPSPQPSPTNTASIAPPAPSLTCTTTTIPFQTSYVDDPSLPQGQQSVILSGINGYTVECSGSAPQTVPPQNEIVSLGTLQPDPATAAPAADPGRSYQDAHQYCASLPSSLNPDTTNAMKECIKDFMQS